VSGECSSCWGGEQGEDHAVNPHLIKDYIYLVRAEYALLVVTALGSYSTKDR